MRPNTTTKAALAVLTPMEHVVAQARRTAGLTPAWVGFGSHRFYRNGRVADLITDEDVPAHLAETARAKLQEFLGNKR